MLLLLERATLFRPLAGRGGALLLPLLRPSRPLIGRAAFETSSLIPPNPRGISSSPPPVARSCCSCCRGGFIGVLLRRLASIGSGVDDLALPGNVDTVPSVTPSVVTGGGELLPPQLLVLVVVFESANVVLKLSSCSRTSSCSSWKSFHLEEKKGSFTSNRVRRHNRL